MTDRPTGAAAPDKFYIWEGVYPGYAEAARDAVGPGFAGDRYNAQVLEATRESAEAVASGKPIPFFYKQRNTLLPAMIATLIGAGERLRILDFGGGLGIGYLTLAEALGDDIARIDYTVLEMPEVCDRGRSVFPDGRVTFVDRLPEGSFDFILAASALQYVEDWQGLLTRFGGYGASFILLSDVFAGTIASFATLQNYYESKIPHWFLALDDVNGVFDRCGYRLAMKEFVKSVRLGVEDVLPMDNFAPEHRLDRTLHLLFRRSA